MKPSYKTVRVIDHVATGADARRWRIVSGLTLRDCGKRMGGMSAAYLCDLEHGKRNWSEELVAKFWEALK